jgi:regulator of cell morphogenesis and NO signaling
MRMQTTEKTVREIALENPASVRVFEALGIDYCCGGQRSLSEACARAEVDVEKTLALLAAAGRDEIPGEWTTRPLSEIIAHIVAHHHGFVRRETPRIAGLLAKVNAKHGAQHSELSQVENQFISIAQELAMHMLKEEQMLFPHIEGLERAAQTGAPAPVAFFGSVTRPIATMIAEHDDAGAILSRLRELTNGYSAPADACPSFVALYGALEDFERDLHRHIHLENNILFPRAAELEHAS